MNLGYTHAFKSHSRSDETVGNFVDTMGTSDDTLGAEISVLHTRSVAHKLDGMSNIILLGKNSEGFDGKMCWIIGVNWRAGHA